MKLASIEKIKEILPHPNADRLSIINILGDQIIIPKDLYVAGELVAFIYPDSILPDKEWTAFYKKKSSRIRAQKFRGSWSLGVVEKLDKVGYSGPIEEGLDITEVLGITKYEPILPSELNAKGFLPFGIGQTDECRWNKLDSVPYGELVDCFLKIDGQSFSAYYTVNNEFGVLGRTLEYQLDCENNYTRVEKKYLVIERLKGYVQKYGTSICLRGEAFGAGVQKGAHNPHSILPLDVAFFSVYLIDERRYARKGDVHYFLNVCKELGLPTVPILEENVVLTPELIKKYDADLEKLNGKNFEGCVVNTTKDSFKIINKYYDSIK